MTKKISIVIVSVVLFALVLSGCKMPASKAPTTPTDQAMTTPIRIQTDSPEFMTQTAIAKSANTATIGADESPEAQPTNTPQPTEVIAVPTLTRPAEYTLQEGEFPFCIARRYDLNPQDLLDLNNLGPDDLLSPGTTIQIPQTGSWQDDSRALLPHPTSHTVSQGETIYSIACDYGDVSPEAIIAVNQLQEPYDLTPDQTLNIP
jgi:LysM repeat protein